MGLGDLADFGRLSDRQMKAAFERYSIDVIASNEGVAQSVEQRTFNP